MLEESVMFKFNDIIDLFNIWFPLLEVSIFASSDFSQKIVVTFDTEFINNSTCSCNRFGRIEKFQETWNLVLITKEKIEWS